MAKRVVLIGFAVLNLVVTSSAFAATRMSPTAFLKAVDKDNDGTITLEELKAFASERFQALETDKDGTLDAKELKGRLSASGFKAANSDADKTIDQGELMAYVEKLFKAANDQDDTLDAKELRSPAGKKLIKLLH